MNKKLLATSLLSAAAFAGLAVGGTYALFTSNAEANIAIQTATVKYEAIVRAESLKTYSLGVEQAAGVFENGGTAALSGNSLTLNNVTPGDKAEFELEIKNASTIKTAYRVRITADNGEAAPFKVTGEAASWVALAPNTNPAENVKVGVELPVSVGDDYQGKNYALKISVEAVQANGVASVAAAADLNQAIAEGKIIELQNDIALTDAIDIQGSPKVDLAGHTLTLPKDKPLMCGVGESIEISNGTLSSVDSTDATDQLLTVTGGTVSVDNVDFEIASGHKQAVPFKCLSGVLNIKNVNVESNRYYVVATNAIDKNAELTINVEDSSIKVANDELDNAAILTNTSAPTHLNIKHSTISGQRQAVFVRTGNAVIENSTLISTGDFLSKEANVAIDNDRLSGNWASGDEAPTAALVVGDRNDTSYNLPASVKLVNTTLTALNGAKKAVIASDGIYTATLTSDTASLAADDIVKIGDTSKITVTIA